jgi:hypothetical protein
MIPTFVPTKPIAHAFTAALQLAQHLELNLRAIIHILDYHSWIAELPLREDQHRRFKDADAFIDTATLGDLITALGESGAIKPRNATRKSKSWKRLLLDACTERNRLAHRYLAEWEFDKLTKLREKKIIRELETIAVKIFAALTFADSVLEQLELLSDRRNKKMNDLLELPTDCDSHGRKYVPKYQRQSLTRKT